MADDRVLASLDLERSVYIPSQLAGISILANTFHFNAQILVGLLALIEVGNFGQEFLDNVQSPDSGNSPSNIGGSELRCDIC